MEFHDRMNAKIAGMNIQGYRTSHGRGLPLTGSYWHGSPISEIYVTVLCLVVDIIFFLLTQEKV